MPIIKEPWDLEAIAEHLGAELTEYSRAPEGKIGFYDRIKLSGSGTTVDFQPGVGMVRILNEETAGMNLELNGLGVPEFTEDGIIFKAPRQNASLKISKDGQIEIFIASPQAHLP